MRREHEERRAERAHQRVQELLPWHLSGRLEPSERRLVVDHLELCASCGDEFRREQVLAQNLRDNAESVPAPHPSALVRLLARIEEPHQPRRARGRLRLRLAALYRSTPVTIRRLAIAQLAASLLLIVALAWRTNPGQAAAPAPMFHTLSDAGAAGSASDLRVIFAAETTEGEIRELLLATRGQIIAGPSAIGSYVLRIASAAPDPLPAVLAHLRAHPRVRFAEPVAGTGPGGGEVTDPTRRRDE
jgi:Putative zinc-finger